MSSVSIVRSLAVSGSHWRCLAVVAVDGGVERAWVVLVICVGWLLDFDSNVLLLVA